MIDQKKIHIRCLNGDPKKRILALNHLKNFFFSMPNKQQAWVDLHILTNDKDNSVKSRAAIALGSVFSEVPNKEKAWNDLIRLTNDEDSAVRSSAAEALGSAFSLVPDKLQAWTILIRLTNDEDISVSHQGAINLGSAFSDVPNKEQAWNDLHILTYDEDSFVRNWAASALGSVFQDIPDKEQAWNDLHILTYDEDSYVRSSAAEALGSAFYHIPDKEQAWNDLMKLIYDTDWSVRNKAGKALGSSFSHVSDKEKVWNDLIRVTNDQECYERSRAAIALGSAFSYVPDKQKAWNDLHRLINDEDNEVRYWAACDLISAFSDVPDKQQAWNDLIRLANDENRNVSHQAACNLISPFAKVIDKKQAWNDLHNLTYNKDRFVRFRVAYTLYFVFSQVSDKEQAWNDLIRLTSDEDTEVRYWAVSTLGSAFLQVSDKQNAWKDLHRLTNYEDNVIKPIAAEIIGFTFSKIPDKQQAWDDLIRLTNDEDSNVRAYSNHSLGRVSIFKASQTKKEEDYKIELEKAIEFFEIASKESESWNNPAQFCLPFYRSFYVIIFKKQEAKEEVNKYLEEAKAAIKNSKSKKQLFEAVENLAEALKEVQNYENLDFQGMKGELNLYRNYCEYAAELMKDTDEKAHFATEVLRKGLPILDRSLKELLEEIQRKANIACKESKGTATEEITCEINRKVQKWEIGSQEEMTENVEDLISVLGPLIKDILENKRMLEKIEKIKSETDLSKQYKHLIFIISGLPKTQVINMTQFVNIANNPQAQIQIGSINQINGNAKEEHVKSKIKVLFLASNPKATEKLALDEEIREITQKIRASDYRDSIDLTSAWAVRPDDLIQMLNQHKPQIVHFSGHGSKSKEIIQTHDIGELKPLNNRNLRPPIVKFSGHGNVFEEIILTSDSGEPKPVSKEALIKLFTALKDNINVVVLNCCYSKEQAKAITQVIDCAVGMNSAIGDKAAIIFAASFYRAIGFGRSVKNAFDQGIAALLLEDIPEENTPELLVKDGVDPSQVIPLGSML